MSEWTTTTLKDICEPMNGIWKGVKEPFISAKILRATNFSKDCKLKLDDVAIIDVEKKKLDSRRLQRGDIVVEKSGGGPNQPVGRVILFNLDDGDYSFCNFTSALRIKDKSKVLPEFLYKYLVYLYFEGETEKYQSNLVGFRNLDFKGYTSMVVRFPNTISEQQRIVDLLDKEFEKIDRLRSNAELNLCHAKDLFQAALKKELEPKDGWKSYSLLEASLAGGQYGMSVPSKAYDGIRYLRITDITDDGELNDDLVSANTDVIDNKYILQDGDILFARTGATVGKTLVYDPNMGKCSYAGYLIMYRPNPSIVLPRLLHYITHSTQYYAWVISSQTQAVLQNISAKLYNTFSFSIPSVEEQKQIVATLDNLSAKCKVLRDNYTKTIALCEDMKRALLKRAFNGEL